VSLGGILYFGNLDNEFHAVDAFTGKVLWKKTLKKRGKEAVGIHSSPTFYRSSVIVVCGDGYLYSFHRKTGRKIWGPINLRYRVYSNPVVRRAYIYVATAGPGSLRVLRARDGKAVFKKGIPLGTPVYSTPLLVKTEFSFKGKKGKKKRTYFVYITAPSKLIKLILSPGGKSHHRRPDIELEGNSLSSPAYRPGRLYFATREFLYCVNLRNEKVAWIKKVPAIAVTSARKTYPTPILKGNVVFHGLNGYHSETGAKVWKHWSLGKVTTDSVATSKMMYTGGKYKLYGRIHGFVAGVDLELENDLFWLTVSKPLSSPVILSYGILYFASSDNKLHAFSK